MGHSHTKAWRVQPLSQHLGHGYGAPGNGQNQRVRAR